MSIFICLKKMAKETDNKNKRYISFGVQYYNAGV